MQRKKYLSRISWRTKNLFMLRDLEWFLVAVVACCSPVVKKQHEEGERQKKDRQSRESILSSNTRTRILCAYMCPHILPWDNQQASWSSIFPLRICFSFLYVILMRKSLVMSTDTFFLTSPCVQTSACVHRERVRGLCVKLSSCHF